MKAPPYSSHKIKRNCVNFPEAQISSSHAMTYLEYRIAFDLAERNPSVDGFHEK